MTISRGQMPRQLYGLGSLVKKITKPIKKVLKSDLGKAALLATPFIPFGGPGTSLFSKFGSSAIGQGLGKFFTENALGKVIRDVGVGSLVGGGLDYLQRSQLPDPEEKIQGRSREEIDEVISGLKTNYENLGYEPGEIDLLVEQYINQNYPGYYRAEGGRIGYAEGNPDQKQMAMVEDMLKRGMDMDTIKTLTGASDEVIQDRINFIKYGGAKVPIEKANGGRIGYAFGDSAEDNAMQAAGIMDLPLNQNPAGVTELDLRETGGFIPPVGVKEKADDIPAMLSNNEFVFTADAVKGMGDGDVNKGAERMYSMMKQLENGGRV